MKIWKIRLHLIVEELFKFSLVTYLILLLAETLKEGFISLFFNLNILLAVVLISGVLMVLTAHEQTKKSSQHKKITRADIEYIILFATAAAFVVSQKTLDLGWMSLVIAGITAVIIILLSVLLFTEQE